MLCWFQLRPSQHSGVPEFRSTLNVGASSRRIREATVALAETAADISVLLQTMFPPDEMDSVTPMSSLEFQKRMMVALPNGWAGNQMRVEHPNATYEAFLKCQINETARHPVQLSRLRQRFLQLNLIMRGRCVRTPTA